jgi:hypothetical protein
MNVGATAAGRAGRIGRQSMDGGYSCSREHPTEAFDRDAYQRLADE